MIWDIFSIFRTNCTIGCGTRAYISARIFANVAQGKWRPKSFMLLAQNSRPLWQLEFCLSIFAVSCSASLSEDSAEFRYVPLYIHVYIIHVLQLLQLLHVLRVLQLTTAATRTTRTTATTVITTATTATTATTCTTRITANYSCYTYYTY